MSGFLALMPYVAGVVGASALGGSIPLWTADRSRRIDLYFAASAGVVLGVLGGHLLPEAFKAGPNAAWMVIGGYLFMLVVERFVLPHALHEPSHAAHDAAGHADCTPEEEAAHIRADAAGIGAFVGMSLHTIADGLALGAVVENPKVAPYVFMAIVAHKVPSAFALGTLLVRARVRTARVVAGVAALGGMVGLGGILFLVARHFSGFDSAKVMPFAVAFSAGSFLHVALTDLLPDLHPKGGRQRELLFALVGGLIATVALTWLAGE